MTDNLTTNNMILPQHFHKIENFNDSIINNHVVPDITLTDLIPSRCPNGVPYTFCGFVMPTHVKCGTMSPEFIVAVVNKCMDAVCDIISYTYDQYVWLAEFIDGSQCKFTISIYFDNIGEPYILEVHNYTRSTSRFYDFYRELGSMILKLSDSDNDMSLLDSLSFILPAPRLFLPYSYKIEEFDDIFSL